jgi:MOSC domain-containing protein YiiM
LERALEAMTPSPRDRGRVALLNARGPDEGREDVPSATLTPADGLPEDRWAADRAHGEEKYGDDYADMQLATREIGVAELIANGQPLALFGDNLFLELDLSDANLPQGSRLRVGNALLEVTPFPHNGCHKFRDRFGADALRLVSEKARRPRNLRGIYLRVLEEGKVSVGDQVEVVSRL